jgi:hypothetical protein
MRIFFLNDDNSYEINNHFKNLYNSIVDIFENNSNNSNNLNNSNDKIDSIELCKTMKDRKFMEYFLDKGLKILEKVRYKTISNHNTKCIVRAVFDILFKYIFDTECKIYYYCCDKNKFIKLEFEILNDIMWKIND